MDGARLLRARHSPGSPALVTRHTIAGCCRKVVVVHQKVFNCLLLLVVGGSLLAGCATRPSPKAETAGGAHDPAALTLIAEMALARGDCKTASETYAEAAVYGDAPPVARHASTVALACEHVPAAWKAASRWRALAPGDRQASAMYATVAIKLYRIPDARAAIIDFAKAQRAADSSELGELAGLLLEQ